MRHLVLFDTDRIQDYIFATTTLKEIRGASALLDKMNRTLTPPLVKKYGGQEIYLGGGAGAAWWEDIDRARDFCAELTALYREKTITAGVTAHIQEQPDPKDFLGCLAKGELFLRRRKEAKRREAPLVANPYFKVCELCGQLPAVTSRRGFPETLVCTACDRRMRPSDDYKHSLVYQELEKILEPDPVNYPDILEDIGAGSYPQGYLGLIYADGNRMGQVRQAILQDAADPEGAYRLFSQALDAATRQAMVRAVHQHLPFSPGQTYPVQFFISGGDDVLAAVPAHMALPVALAFCENFANFFENGLPGNGGQELVPAMGAKAAMSVGVALAKVNYPLHSLIKTAKELLKSAKRRAWEEWSQDPTANPATVDFLSTSSSLLEPVEAQRQALEYDGVKLTCRPYSMAEAQTLLGGIAALKKSRFPRNKVVELGRALHRGRLQACLDSLVLLSRLGNGEVDSPRQALLKVAQDFNLYCFPWRLTSRGQYETPLLDLVELYDFVAG